jgi:hypothetical protein
MKHTPLAFALFLLTIASSFAVELGIGSKSGGLVTIPDGFLHENDDETTIFLMPRKNDPDGPISMRLTCLRDLSDARLSPQQIQALLDRVNPKSALLHFGANLATTQAEDTKDDRGAEWHDVHYAVYADNFLITVTISTVKRREKEPQCKELLDEIPRILASLKRKKA